MSEDPAQDGTNWYNYCQGNPISNIDPTGLVMDKKMNSGNPSDNHTNGAGPPAPKNAPDKSPNGNGPNGSANSVTKTISYSQLTMNQPPQGYQGSYSPSVTGITGNSAVADPAPTGDVDNPTTKAIRDFGASLGLWKSDSQMDQEWMGKVLGDPDALAAYQDENDGDNPSDPRSVTQWAKAYYSREELVEDHIASSLLSWTSPETVDT